MATYITPRVTPFEKWYTQPISCTASEYVACSTDGDCDEGSRGRKEDGEGEGPHGAQAVELGQQTPDGHGRQGEDQQSALPGPAD
jgi:hypothetical protein